MTICFRMLQPVVATVPSHCFGKALIDADLWTPSRGGGHRTVAAPPVGMQHLTHLAGRQHGDIAGRAMERLVQMGNSHQECTGYCQAQRPDADVSGGNSDHVIPPITALPIVDLEGRGNSAWGV